MKQMGTAKDHHKGTSQGFEDTQVEYWAKFIQLQDLQCQCKLSFAQYLLNLSGRWQSQFLGTQLCSRQYTTEISVNIAKKSQWVYAKHIIRTS